MSRTAAERPLDLASVLESYRSYLEAIAAASLGPDLQAKVGRSDLVQETFLAAGRDARSFRGETEADLKAWLCGILRHLISNTRRHFRGVERRRIDREIPLNNLAIEPEDPATSIMTRQFRVERDEVLASAIARLPDSYRRILEWHNRDGWTFDRIGHEMGISEGAARKQWARALLRLRDYVESET